jgi:hypothetical protein
VHRLSLLFGLAFFSSTALAHRLDEYLQATLVTIDPGEIRFQINLTPGVEVADEVLQQMDRDHDGVISTNEASAYCEVLKRDLSVQLDGHKIDFKLTASNFPALAELRTGWGIMQMEFSAPIGPLAPGAHKLSFENRHLPRLSVYLFNAAQPKSASVRIVTQKRNQNQSTGEIEFAVGNQGLKTQHFDRDPGWEGFNNHTHLTRTRRVVQDFGYSGGEPGQSPQIGGRVTRASQPGYYAEALTTKSLGEKLSASGRFQITSSSSGSGVFFGWFNSRQHETSGRPISSFGLDFDGEAKGARLAVRLISHSNKSCGTFITPFIPGKYRPTPIRNDGTLYDWSLVYDPNANAGLGRFEFRLQSEASEHEPFEGKWFTVDLPAGFKADGATFDRFGLMNALKPGGSMTIAFQELQLDGKMIDFSRTSEWIGSGNRTNYDEANPAGAHDFGFSPRTSFAGGSPGEVGGNFWRSGSFAYYADPVGLLSLERPLEASGRVVLLVGAPDSDMYLGWFNSAVTNSAIGPRSQTRPLFLGVHVGGPTRVGHYFQPAYALEQRVRTPKTGPVLKPEQSYDWTLHYEPPGTNGSGNIVVRLGGESVSLQLPRAQLAAGTLFDRFGLFTSTIGGQMVRIFFDDFKYTAAQK